MLKCKASEFLLMQFCFTNDHLNQKCQFSFSSPFKKKSLITRRYILTKIDLVKLFTKFEKQVKLVLKTVFYN